MDKMRTQRSAEDGRDHELARLFGDPPELRQVEFDEK